MGNIVVTVGIFLLLLTLLLHLNNAVEFKFTNVICKSSNVSWFVVHNCRLNAINRHKTVYNFNGTFLHPVNDIVIDVQLFQKANGYKPWLFKASINVCRFLKKPFNPVIIIIFKIFRDFSNFNHTCPYEGTVFIDNLYIDADKIPVPMPSGDYLLEVNYLFDKKTQIFNKFFFYINENN